MGHCDHCGHWIRHNVHVTFDNTSTGTTAVFCSRRCKDVFIAAMTGRTGTCRRGGSCTPPDRIDAPRKAVIRLSNQRQVQRILWFNTCIKPLGDREFRASELGDVLNLSVDAISARLRNLALDGLVEHANNGVHKRWRVRK